MKTAVSHVLYTDNEWYAMMVYKYICMYECMYERTYVCMYVCMYVRMYVRVYVRMHVYRVSQEQCARPREGVPYVKVYRYTPKHLYPKLNGYGDNGQRKVEASCGSKYCNLHN